jgi:Zn-dependent protease with chaperone function
LPVAGHYFQPGLANFNAASLETSDDGEILIVRDGAGTVLAQAPRRQVQATSRLGNVRRRLDFPKAGRFETDDNDGADILLRQNGGFLHRLEQSWRMVLASVMAAGAAAAWFAFYGVPIAAGWLASHTPPGVSAYLTSQTLETLDGRLLHPTKLKPAEQRHFGALFAQMASHETRGQGGYRLLLRNAPLIGPNAFALPDGTIVLTDQLAALVMKDDEIRGVFGHEIAHVNRGHVLQRIYQAAMVPAAVAFVTGDATQVGHIATVTPGVLLQSVYSRGFEQQADDDSAKVMRGMSSDPAALGDLLLRLDRKLCGAENGCEPGWLSSHPLSADRAARLRKAR